MSRAEKIQDLHFDAVLPSHLLLNQEIEPNAKVFYAFVRNLTKSNGFCYASNDYLTELMDCDERTIRRWLSSLQEQGYIEIFIKIGTKDRKIYLSQKYITATPGDDENLGQKQPTPRTKTADPLGQKCPHKEDSIKEDSERSSSSTPPNPESRKDNSLREQLRKRRKITFTDEEFEDSYIRMKKSSVEIPNPLGWLEADIPMRQGIRAEDERIEIKDESKEWVPTQEESAQSLKRIMEIAEYGYSLS